MEQPLPPYGACLLGSFNLTKYMVYDPIYKRWSFDFYGFKRDIPVVVRAMDNIIDRCVYPLPNQQWEAQNKRRMGLGVTGLANAIEAMGYPYASKEYREIKEEILKTLAHESYRASIELAKEKGSFPLFNAEKFGGEFFATLPQDIQDDVRKYGIRNSHLLSIAPTGTISLSADNISSGIEPVFSYGYDRIIQTETGPITERVEDYGYRVFGVEGKTAGECSVFDHVDMLTLAAQYVDSACSKTCNVGDDVTWEEFKEVYMRAYEGGAVGCTTFRASGKRAGIFIANASEDVAEAEEVPVEEEFINESEGGACYYDPTTGKRTCE